MIETPASMKDDRIVAQCYAELGDVTKENGEYDASLSYHRRSMEIFERLSDPLCVADSHLNIAAVYKAKGEIKQAMREYEKGLSLYENAVVDDAYKKCDSGMDLSLSSSSFSDRQLIRKLSKSDETLSQTKLTDFIEKDIHTSSSDMLSSSESYYEVFVPTKRKFTPQFTTNICDSTVFLSESMNHGLTESFSSSSSSDILLFNDNDMESPVSSTNLSFETTFERETEENNIRPRCLNCQAPVETDNCDETTKLGVKTKSNTKIWNYFMNKQFLIVILIILVAVIISRSFQNNAKKPPLFKSTNNSPSLKNSRMYHHDDISEQLRKILPLRKDRIQSLSKNRRRIIESFINNLRNRTKMTLEKLQTIMDILELKLVLVPR